MYMEILTGKARQSRGIPDGGGLTEAEREGKEERRRSVPHARCAPMDVRADKETSTRLPARSRVGFVERMIVCTPSCCYFSFIRIVCFRFSFSCSEWLCLCLVTIWMAD